MMKRSFHKRARTATRIDRRPHGIEPLEDRRLLTTFTVTNTLDDGSAGSLRWAITQSNNTGGVDQIAFNIASANKIIRPGSELPGLWDPAILDATTQPGYAGRPLVQIDGASAGAGITGLKVWGQSTVKGLSITNFGGSAIDVFSRGLGGSNTFQANWIGLDLAGNAAGNNAQGIGVWGVANNLIGGPNAADRNVISASRGALGVLLQGAGATNNTIQNNYIGTDPTGTQARGNAWNGIGIQDAPRNSVLNNVLSANRHDGIIIINPSATNNVVKGNIVGLGVNGAPLPNGDYGIELNIAANNNQIGGPLPSDRNFFSSNVTAGVVLQDVTGNVVENNYIGTDLTGTQARPNGFQGVAVVNAHGNTYRNNLVSGNAREGFGIFPGNNNTITGNVVGFSSTGAPLTNGTWGIALYDSSTGNVVTGNHVANHPSGNIGGNPNNTTTGNVNTPPASTTVPGSFSFGASAYNANENQGTVTITVNRTAGTTVAASVNYATSNNTAAAGSDYTATSGTLSFAAGETSKTFTVPLLNDAAVEGNEVVNMTLSNPTGGATLGNPSTATLTIASDDAAVPGAFSLGSATYSVNEAAGTVTVTVLRSANTNVPASVGYATANNSAVAGSDYTAASGVLDFDAGETSKSVTVPIVNDAAFEQNESFTVALSNPTGGATLGATASATVTIVSDDAAPDTTAPRVTAAAFDRTARQHTLRYTFSEDVYASLSLADVYVADQVTYQTQTPTGYAYDRASNTATFTFAAQIPEGRYGAYLFADGITDAAGNKLDGDGNGLGGDSHEFAFHFMPGDATGDGRVDFNDLVRMSQNYEKVGGMTYATGDFDYDGSVDFDDLVILSQNYDTSLITPSSATAAFSAPAPVAPVTATPPTTGSTRANPKSSPVSQPLAAKRAPLFSAHRI
jgi:parallel beta-helix repeat protein